jgi:hypothetical protein
MPQRLERQHRTTDDDEVIAVHELAQGDRDQSPAPGGCHHLVEVLENSVRRC